MIMEEQLRQKAKELLESGEVKVVIGYGQGSAPFKSTPIFIEKPEDAHKLIWNPTCVNNLTVYLRDACRQGKAAIVVKPCDARSIIELIRENQIERDDVVILAMSCPGVLNLDALAEIDLADVKSVEWHQNGIAIKTNAGETIIPSEKAFASKCLSCELAESPIADEKFGEPIERHPIRSKYADIEELEKMLPEERRAYWARQFARCIRCYACRSVCPGCYCKECFTDKPCQLWVLRSTDVESNWFFHFSRAMHTAGRCIACGECERVCPMGIPLMRLNQKMRKEVREMFGEEAGTNPEAPPTLGTFDLKKDPDPCSE